MFNPVQPQFKIRVFNGGKVRRVQPDKLKKTNVAIGNSGDYIDIEHCVAFPVTYEEQASLLNTLSFTVDKFADVLLYYFHIGQTVILYGGFYSDNQSSMRKVFSGTVTRIKTQFSDNGRVSFSVECMNYGFTKMGKDYRNFVYPDISGSRKFARKDSMTVSDIIVGIAEENKLDVGILDLTPEAKKVVFTNKNIRYQKNVSDWKFLTMLAKDFGCTVWISNEDGFDTLNFASWEKAAQEQSEIQFLYPLYGVVTDVKEQEMQRFSVPAYDRPRILRSVTVDEDISMAYAVSRSSVYFDKETGEYKEAVSKITTDANGNNKITFYELDEQRVEYIHKTRPDIADKMRSGGPTSMEWGTPDNPENASYYYRVINIYDEHVAVFDKAFFGITVSATCNQDLDIRSQRIYRIRGILSYHSKDLETSFFLRGLKHIWDSDGTWTELDFIR